MAVGLISRGNQGTSFDVVKDSDEKVKLVQCFQGLLTTSCAFLICDIVIMDGLLSRCSKPGGQRT